MLKHFKCLNTESKIPQKKMIIEQSETRREATWWRGVKRVSYDLIQWKQNQFFKGPFIPLETKWSNEWSGDFKVCFLRWVFISFFWSLLIFVDFLSEKKSKFWLATNTFIIWMTLQPVWPDADSHSSHIDILLQMWCVPSGNGLIISSFNTEKRVFLHALRHNWAYFIICLAIYKERFFKFYFV